MKNEKERQINYYNYEKLTKSLVTKIENLMVKKIPLAILAKSLDNIADHAEVSKSKSILDGINIGININGESGTMLYKNFHNYVIKKSMEIEKSEKNLGFSFDKITVISTPENPYQHELTKSLGIEVLNEEFLCQNQILTKSLYDEILLMGDKAVDTDLGYWNITMEKAISSINDFKPVKKIVNLKDKAKVTTLYILESE